MSDNDYAIQLNVKYGPTDDRGNHTDMLNVRGYTVGEIYGHLVDLSEQSHLIAEAVNKFKAVHNVAQNFRQTQPAPNQHQPQGQQQQQQQQPARGVLAHRNGELCGPHQLPMRYKSGLKKGTQDYYELLECTAPNNPCRPIWPD